MYDVCVCAAETKTKQNKTKTLCPKDKTHKTLDGATQSTKAARRKAFIKSTILIVIEMF